MSEGRGDYPYRDSAAATALSEAIDAKQGEASLRQLASELNYKSAVVLSHMRTGRLPIPVERAQEIAKVVGLSPDTFLKMVLKQRFENVDFSALETADGVERAPSEFSAGTRRVIADLSAHAGCASKSCPRTIRPYYASWFRSRVRADAG